MRADRVAPSEETDMEELIRNQWLWTVVLGVLLFLPARQMIWVMSVRREERKQGRAADDAQRQALRRRASVTSALLCFVFSVLYVQVMFRSIHGQP